LGKFFAALHREPSQAMQDFFFLALLTGARRGNVASMTWDDVNLEWRLWRIPGTVAKSGEPIVVPLVPAAVEVLQRRRMGANGSLWVFPSRGKTGHIVEVKGAWKRILTAAGLPDVRPHDLRRTLGSWQAIGGASLPIIGRSLGHSQPSTTQVYARLQLDPVRASVTAATDAMLAAGNGQLLGNDPVLKG
jgi:integrase